MRLAFFGSSLFSTLILAPLLESRHTVAGIVSQPDQPAGRRMQLAPTPVSRIALAAGVLLLRPVKLRGNDAIAEQLAALEADAVVTASYGKIIPSGLLDLTSWPLNVHPSLLPQLRGASPIRTALLQGLGATGCCIMHMTPRLDDGPTLACQGLAIEPDWNHETLERELGQLGAGLLLRSLEQIEAGAAGLTEQDHGSATYCGTYARADTRVDWSRSAAELSCFIRAWDPDIGATTTLPDGKLLKIWRATAAQAVNPSAAPGTVLDSSKSGLAVACGSGALSLLEVQPESKRRMDCADFLRGTPLRKGDVLGSGGAAPIIG